MLFDKSISNKCPTIKLKSCNIHQSGYWNIGYEKNAIGYAAVVGKEKERKRIFQFNQYFLFLLLFQSDNLLID